MSTYTQICYHIVFSTKDRQPTLRADRRQYHKLLEEAGIEFDERYVA